MIEVIHPFRLPAYRFFWAARLASTLASSLMVVVIGIHVYDIARETMSIERAAFWLGMVGLAQFLPLLLLTLVAGYVADRIDRKLIVRACLALELVCAAFLAADTWAGSIGLPGLFLVAVLLGIGRAFAGPALSAFAPNLVPPPSLPTAIALSSIAWQAGNIAGPLIGGVAYAVDRGLPYALSVVLFGVSLAAISMVGRIPLGEARGSNPLGAVVEGLRYVRGNPIVLGAITLDLFAVLLGGATALLPVYARDILHVGAEGLGALRAAPAAGAALTALVLSRWPLRRQVGIKMFACVGLFGLSTVVFGLSRAMPLSLAALVVLGAADMISVYVRSSLIQLHTPDGMRGRVSAVSGLFVSASNELGEFRAGLAGAWLGPQAAVVIGGALAVVVTGVAAVLFPSLRRADRFVAPDAAILDSAGGKTEPAPEAPAMVAGQDIKAEKGLS